MHTFPKLLLAALGTVTAYLAIRPRIALIKAALEKWKGNAIVLRAANGAQVHILSTGCVIQRLLMPDKDGDLGDVVLGYDTAEPYQDGTSPYFGAVVGRCANRIAAGKFTLEGESGTRTYQLATNNGPNHLHGGNRGFDKVAWNIEQPLNGGEDSVRLTYTSPDGEEGYPGTVEAAVTYTLASEEGDKTVLTATLEATADRPTLVNLTQHSYFNLAGHASGDVLDHELTVLGQHMTPVDATSIPTGEVVPVAGTRFDFTSPRRIGEDLGPDGIDHNYVLHGLGADARSHVRAGTVGNKPQLAAVLAHRGAGRTLRLLTNAPGLQLYTGNFLGGERGKGGALYGRHAAVCLEPQAWPNAANESAFPSVVLRPGETYRHRIVYEFSTWVAYPKLAISGA